MPVPNPFGGVVDTEEAQTKDSTIGEDAPLREVFDCSIERKSQRCLCPSAFDWQGSFQWVAHR